ncbi:glutamine--fructose-6-phosphate transaminase (isomerizing) [Tropicimonas sp. IMCC34043]|uniref:glutamine--fructose-6-phosphate transaminase (isomerizing) n=1 Tax=Tropicimonas sp. IMCC34043 TaxID=2248760 RepID=UPI000E2376B1|nr:glutamine--fructose-6-phosphate transaminase (isomerizing) [Tropicimonas sp. IMCC34043]
MCGIVGVLGNHQAAPLMVEALKRLEYRGYDSAGIATVDHGTLDRRRSVGKLVNLSDLLVHEPLSGRIGIGHTRWATHGAPSVSNAHPHRAGPVAVVHNGIIENYRALRADLAAAGLRCQTETDTETIALLMQHLLDQGLDLRAATAQALARLQGAFALAMIFDGQEDLMIVARRGSPLAIGHGDGEVFVGSDALALAPLTDRITYLDEGDWAVLSRDRIEIYDASGREVERQMQIVTIDLSQAEKGGHRHFMAKEIAEQPTVLGDALNHYLRDDMLVLPEPGLDFLRYDRITMVACGTAYYACVVAKYWFEQIAGLNVEVDFASEFRYREPPIPSRTLALFVSQSGETADTLAALRYCEGKAARIVSVVNVVQSSIARESDMVLPIRAGVEIGVASTKAFTCQLAVLYLLALKAAVDRSKIDPDEQAAHIDRLRHLPGLMNAALAQSAEIAEVAKSVAEAKDVLFLGRGAMYPLALEGALKLKEISYIHAEGYASGELKHGPIALVDPSVPVIVLAPSDALFEKTVSNMQEVMARDGKVLLITDAPGARHAGEGCWKVVVMPEVPAELAPMLYAIPAQLLAYHAAVAKGTDVDQPRNLAKSVTVE